VRLDVLYGDSLVASSEQEILLRSGLNYTETELQIPDAKLWWPNGMGEQPLYTIKVSAKSGSSVDEYNPFKYGIKTLKLNQEKNNDGRRFAFEVNGVSTYCKGGNWIPADSIYARVTDEKYDALIMEAKKANFNMLRIWGGGLYERDIFYEKCDEYGILIWHDFMFSCGLYPDNLEWFRNEVEKEMDYQTKRLRNHASIALWCGNNENHWLSFDAEENIKPPFLGGAICYNSIAPRIVQQNCQNIPYWNSSPFGGEHPNNYNNGDSHIWFDHMMNPDMEKRITPEEYDKVTARFVSEYGYVGPCCKSSIIKYHGGKPLDRNSGIWKMHVNAFEKDTVAAGIAKHYTDPEKLDIDSYILYAGLCQGIIYGYSLESIRFKGNCGGSLFWMYNDTWGEVGWTIIDYYLKRKPSYYFVKRAFNPIKLIMREDNGIVKVMGINETYRKINIDAEYGYLSFDGQSGDFKKATLLLEPFSRHIVLEFEKGKFDFSRGICCIKPLSCTDTVLPAFLRPGEFKNMNVPKAALNISDFKVDGNMAGFTISSDVFAHAVHFKMDDGIKPSDEYFDLLPGEARRIKVFDVPEGFTFNDIKAEYVFITE
jgi:beta-mannosidase